MPQKYNSVIDTLFDAKNRADAEAFAACFADDAVVEDEGLTHRGPVEIREWAAGNNKKYKLTTKVTGVEQHGEAVVVKALVSGEFSGSPLMFRYDLTVRNDKVGSLETSVIS